MIPISRTPNLFSFDDLLYIYFFIFLHIVPILEMFSSTRPEEELVRDEILQEIKQIESSQAVSSFRNWKSLPATLPGPSYDRVTLSRSGGNSFAGDLVSRLSTKRVGNLHWKMLGSLNTDFLFLARHEFPSLLIKILFSKI